MLFCSAPFLSDSILSNPSLSSHPSLLDSIYSVMFYSLLFYSPIPHLICQNSERPLQPVGRSLLGGSGEPLGVVADLRLQRVDVGDDLFGSHDVLRDVDDGLRARQSAAAEEDEIQCQDENI